MIIKRKMLLNLFDVIVVLKMPKAKRKMSNFGDRELSEASTGTFGMANRSVLSGPSSESEQACASAGRRGRCSGCRLICVLSRFLTAFKELQVFGGNEGSASRSEIRPWASPITAMSTTTLVPED